MGTPERLCNGLDSTQNLWNMPHTKKEVLHWKTILIPKFVIGTINKSNWSYVVTIQGVIVLVQFGNYSCDYFLNCTPLSPITLTNPTIVQKCTILIRFILYECSLKSYWKNKIFEWLSQFQSWMLIPVSSTFPDLSTEIQEHC